MLTSHSGVVVSGGVVSSALTTLTVRVSDDLFPEESVQVYVTEYVPITFVLTVSSASTLRAPSTTSQQVAPASVYVVPTSTVTGSIPSIVIMGGIVSGEDPGPSVVKEIPVIFNNLSSDICGSPRPSVFDVSTYREPSCMTTSLNRPCVPFSSTYSSSLEVTLKAFNELPLKLATIKRFSSSGISVPV